MRRILLPALIAFAPLAAQAVESPDHSQHEGHAAMASMLAASTPSDGAVLAQAPRTLALTFIHPVMLQTVAITGPNGAPVNATFRRPASPAMSYAVALPALASGAYEARWTASGMGHAMNGVVRFTVE